MFSQFINLLLENVKDIILGILSTAIAYFLGQRKERKNQASSLQKEIESLYQEIIDNVQKTPPNISSNRYKLLIIERKIKELCKLKKIDVADIISDHAKLSVYATEEPQIDQKKVSKQASKVIEQL